MHVRWRCAVHFRGFHHDAGRWCVWKFGGLAHEWVEKVDDVEVTEPVDAEVAIDAIGVFAVLIHVDTSAENEP